MSRLSSYVLRQMVGPTALFTFLLTGVILLAESLTLLNVVINGGQSAPTFLYMTLLLLPSLLVIILPIAFFAGTLYSLSRLNTDSELVVMQAAGVSRAQLAQPVFVAAAIVMAATYLCALYLNPLGQRTLSDIQVDIRGDVGAALLTEGEFKTPAKGLTVFIHSMSGGDMNGILVNDDSNRDRPITYLAERASLVRGPEGARLIMFNGLFQESHGKQLVSVTFDRETFDLDRFSSTDRTTARKASERYLGELFSPAPAPGLTDANRKSFIADAHNRLSQPLYCIAFALIALAAVTRGRRARGANALRLTIASMSAAALRIAGYGVAGLALSQPWFNILFYIIPLLGAGLALAFLRGFDPMKYLRPRGPSLIENAS